VIYLIVPGRRFEGRSVRQRPSILVVSALEDSALGVVSALEDSALGVESVLGVFSALGVVSALGNE